eukprot:3594206-Amphidinium_carterae.1
MHAESQEWQPMTLPGRKAMSSDELNSALACQQSPILGDFLRNVVIVHHAVVSRQLVRIQ